MLESERKQEEMRVVGYRGFVLIDKRAGGRRDGVKCLEHMR